MDSELRESFQCLHIEEVSSTITLGSGDSLDLDSIRPFVPQVDEHSLLHLLNVLKNARQKLLDETITPSLFWSCLYVPEKGARLIPSILCCLCEDKSVTSLFASAVYFMLLQVPGAAAYQLFQPLTVQAALRALVNCNEMAYADAAEQKTASTETSRPKRASRTGSKAAASSAGSDEDDISMWSAYCEAVRVAGDWLHAAALTSAELHTAAVDTMVAIAQSHAPRLLDDQKGHPSAVAFAALLELCSPRNGDAVQLARFVLRRLLPVGCLQAMQSGAATSTAVPRESSNAQLGVMQLLTQMLKYEGVEKRTFRAPVLAFLQHVCVRVPDRAEYRHHTADAIRRFCLADAAITTSFVRFLEALSRSAKGQHRLFAVELAATLLQDEHILRLLAHGIVPSDPVTAATPSDDEDGQLILLGLVVARCMDKGPAVRARALACLSGLLTTDAHTLLVPSLRKLVFIKTPELSPVSQSQDALAATPVQFGLSPNSESNSPLSPFFSPRGAIETSRVDVMALLRRRAHDERPNVRKAALQALESVAVLLGDASLLTADDLSILANATSDQASGIRKQAVQSLTRLLQQYADNAALQTAWLKSVPAGVLDPETTVQDRCVDAVLEVALLPASRVTSPECQYVWTLLGNMDTDCARYMQRAIAMVAKSGRIPAGLTKHLLGHVQTNNASRGAWILLDELSTHVPKQFDAAVIHQCWSGVREADDEEICAHVLSVMTNTASQFEPSVARSLADDLLSLLRSLACPTSLAHHTVLALDALCEAHGGAEAKRITSDWAKELVDVSLSCLQPLVDGSTKAMTEHDIEQAQRAVFLLGELSLIMPNTLPAAAITYAQALVPPALAVGGHNLVLQPALRAHALIAIGKMCLSDEALAKKSVPLFAEQLNAGDAPAVRNNVIVILSDLCVRYTALVDRYVPLLSLCLADANHVVRKHTLMLLTKLLGEDYIKWKGLLLYRFLCTLADPISEVAEFAKYCLFQILLRKSPLLLFNHMPEIIFYLNDYQTHSMYNKYVQSEHERRLFCFPGKENESKRMCIYTVLLQSLTDEQKFHLSGKICTDILGGVCDGAVDADSLVLSDGLRLLLSKDIKLTTMRAKADDEETTADSQMQQALQAVRGKLLSKMMKVNLVEHVIPIVVDLKSVLEKQHSPLLRYLMQYLKELMVDYKEEVSDILVADPQLAREVEYDLRRYEEEQQQLQRQRLAAIHTPAPVRRVTSAAVGSPATPAVHQALTPRTPLRAPAAGSDVAPFSAPRLRRTVSAPTADADLVKSPSVIVLPDPDAENRNSDEADGGAFARTRSAPLAPSAAQSTAEPRKRARAALATDAKPSPAAAAAAAAASPEHVAKSVRVTRSRAKPLRQPNL